MCQDGEDGGKREERWGGEVYVGKRAERKCAIFCKGKCLIEVAAF